MLVCPDCGGGFVEEFEHTTRPPRVESRRRRFPAAAMYMIGNHPRFDHNLLANLRRTRRHGDGPSAFNPVIVLRGSPNGSGHDGGSGEGADRGFQLYHDDGTGSGLRPLTPTRSEMLLGSGFDRLLEQLSQIEINGIAQYEHPPASKAAIDSLPTIEIHRDHLASESHCTICMEPFQLGTAGREMPCKHMYHSECILSWLALRNSCPVCRHEIPADTHSARVSGHSLAWNDDENVGLTIWRLPGGGFAIGRFAGRRRGSSDRELPLVYTEMDGGFGNGGEPRRVTWSSRENRGRESGGGLRRMFRNLFGCFSCGAVAQPSASTSYAASSESGALRRIRSSRSGPDLNGSVHSQRTWSTEGDSAMRSS